MRVVIAAGALAVILLIVVSQTFYTLDQTQQAVITRLGVYQRAETKPGLKVKAPFIETVHLLDKRLLRFESAPSEYLTSEKKALVIDSYTRYRITNAQQFFEAVGTESQARGRLEAIIPSEIRQEVATHTQDEVISTSREQLMEDVTKQANEKAKPFGIEVDDVRIVRADFPTEVASSVYQRMESERAQIAAQFRAEGVEQSDKIKADADLQKRTILAQANETAANTRGEGEAEASRIMGQAINLDPEFYSFVRTLDAYENAVKKGTTLVIPSDSEFYQFFTDAYPVGSPQRKTQ